MHWGFWAAAWWTISLLVAAAVHREWVRRYGPTTKCDVAASITAILVAAYGVYATTIMGLA